MTIESKFPFDNFEIRKDLILNHNVTTKLNFFRKKYQELTLEKSSSGEQSLTDLRMESVVLSSGAFSACLNTSNRVSSRFIRM